MGIFVHGNGTAGFEIEDRKLSHIKILVGLKLDRGQSFYLSWNRPLQEGSGRISVWISVGTPLQFRFRRRERPQINHEWIEYMMRNSFGPRGVVIVDEDDAMGGKPLAAGLLD